MEYENQICNNKNHFNFLNVDKILAISLIIPFSSPRFRRALRVSFAKKDPMTHLKWSRFNVIEFFLITNPTDVASRIRQKSVPYLVSCG